VARSIAVTYDYRFPFAYNGNAAVVAVDALGVAVWLAARRLLPLD
jgi:hypothetical protein